MVDLFLLHVNTSMVILCLDFSEAYSLFVHVQIFVFDVS